MSVIIRCCLIMCYFFMFVIIMFKGGIYYKLTYFFSFLFPNMYISSCIACLYVFKLEMKFDVYQSHVYDMSLLMRSLNKHHAIS